MKGGLEAITEVEADLRVRISSRYSFADLRAALDHFVQCAELEDGSEDRIELTRASALGLLDCLLQTLARPMRQSAVDDPHVSFDHPSITLLRDLRGAIEDLDKQRTHKALEPAFSNRGRSLPKRSEMYNLELVRLLEIYAELDGMTLKAASKRLATDLQAQGRRGISAQKLLNLRKVAIRNGWISVQHAD